ncbi:MAG TPA: 2-oxoacid:ferredoxin oxidoreductase subunit beta [Burkholderiaceae bacterium]
MSAVPLLDAQAYRSDYKPIWCPGCGDYTVVAALAKAFAELGLARENTVLVSGIGCSSRLPAYASTYGFHGVHGRALALATGVKVARPELTVVVASGDGDAFSIGGNHFLHAARRNVDLTCIVMDNQVYGMTKGQASPTTPADWCESALTPHGTGVTSFHPLVIAVAAGATFVARGFAGDPSFTKRLIVEAIRHRGFSLVQILSPCVTYRPEQKEWKSIVRRGKEFAPTAAHAAKWLLTDDGFNTGILFQEQRPVFDPRRAGEGSLARIEAEFRAG